MKKHKDGKIIKDIHDFIGFDISDNWRDWVTRKLNWLIDKIKGTPTRIKSDHTLYQTLMCEPYTGFDGHQIFEGAQNSPQGMAYIKHEGIEKIFMLTRVEGSAWEQGEKSRIVEYEFKDDGSITRHISFSQPLLLSHQGISAYIEDDGQLYLYCGASTGGGNDAAKGFSKVKWDGYNTTQEHVTTYQTFGLTNSDHYLAWANHATISVSTDGKYIVMAVSTMFDSALRYAFVYDRKKTENCIDPLDSYPLTVFKIQPPPMLESHVVQDITSDGERIYIYSGYLASGQLSANVISIYSVTGRYLGYYLVEGAMGDYTKNQVFNGEGGMGKPTAFEPEGLAIRDNELLILTNDVWELSGKYTRRTQKVHVIGEKRGSCSQPINRGFMPVESPASLHLYGTTKDISIPAGDALQIVYWDEMQRTFRDMLTYNLEHQLRLYDARNGANNNHYSSVNTHSLNGREYMELRSNINIDNGAGLSLYSKNDSVARGQAILYALGQDNTPYNVRLQETGQWRSGTDGVQSLGTANYRWKNIYATGSIIETSDERRKTDITPIDDKVLDAWQEVEYFQYKFISSIEEKGENARLHIGVIAQHIKDTFERHGLNALEYGLICYDEWDEQDEIFDVDEEGNKRLIQEKREAGSLWSVRATECLYLESALMRRELQRMREELS